MFKLKVEGAFEAAHRIVGYPGKCNRLHGHNWRVEIELIGSELDELGMLVDFGEAKKYLSEVLNTLDHNYINDLPSFSDKNPTAENLAKYIYDELDKRLKDKQATLTSVSVYESPHSSVTYIPDEA